MSPHTENQIPDFGFSVDPASAASLAGGLTMPRGGVLEEDGPLVCVLTSSGARWPHPHAWAPVGMQLAATSAGQAFRAVVALTS